MMLKFKHQVWIGPLGPAKNTIVLLVLEHMVVTTGCFGYDGPESEEDEDDVMQQNIWYGKCLRTGQFSRNRDRLFVSLLLLMHI